MLIEPRYFGCHRVSGHYCWTPDRQHEYNRKLMPLAEMLVPDAAPEGLVYGHHLFIDSPDELTVIGFTDNSVDRRPGSKSVFIFGGRMHPDEALRLARARFGWVFERFSFSVRSQTEGAPP